MDSRAKSVCASLSSLNMASEEDGEEDVKFKDAVESEFAIEIALELITNKE